MCISRFLYLWLFIRIVVTKRGSPVALNQTSFRGFLNLFLSLPDQLVTRATVITTPKTTTDNDKNDNDNDNDSDKNDNDNDNNKDKKAKYLFLFLTLTSWSLKLPS